jgi:hypothetical protein
MQFSIMILTILKKLMTPGNQIIKCTSNNTVFRLKLALISKMRVTEPLEPRRRKRRRERWSKKNRWMINSFKRRKTNIVYNKSSKRRT